MTAIQLKKGEYLIQKGTQSQAVYIVLKGSVKVVSEHNEFVFGSGSVLGITSAYENAYICDYIGNEDSLIASYRYEEPTDFFTIFEEQEKYGYAFLHASINQYNAIHSRYLEAKTSMENISDFVNRQLGEYELECARTGAEPKEVMVAQLQQLTLPEVIRTWEKRYFQELSEQPEKSLRAYYFDKPGLCVGEILRFVNMTVRLIKNLDALSEFRARAQELLISEEEDLLEVWFDYALQLAKKDMDTMSAQIKVIELQDFLNHTHMYSEDEVSTRMNYYNSMDFKQYVLNHKEAAAIQTESSGEVAETMSKADVLRTDFASYIMNYAGFEKEEIAHVKELLKEYAVVAVATDNSTPECQKVRKELTMFYYQIYERAFLRAVKAQSISTVMELFFQFGVLDLQLVGEDHLGELLGALETIHKQQEEQKARIEAGESFAHVFTIYQWLGMVYRGEREPSKNDFDIDYLGDLLEQRKQNLITRAQENELKKDQLKKLQFEIRNMFTTNNRITYGRITSFCPVLHAKDFIREVSQMLLTVDKMNEGIDELRSLDYSCFYREVHFVAPEHGIDRTEIQKEVLPEIILMPNIGGRAMMWQETSGVKRDTPARFVFPIMTIADLPQMMMETAGRYRWEICRKILGVRWNDIREKSLTSEFYDYVQFYRKNRELTPQAKEKVKSDLLHAKNNYREVFVNDYVGWMKYEAQGNFRLNKVSRRILADYVPFPKSVRRKLAENPMYKELFTKSDIIAGRKKEKERILFERYTSSGGEMTPELQAHMSFYDK